MARHAFAVLGLDAHEDDDESIREAYHACVRAGRADAAVNAAYAAIRHAADRRRYRWVCPAVPIGIPRATGSAAPEIAPLVQELASLSDWELGEPA
ncbi:MAG: hypothetical protein ACOCZK_02755 [Planctomycetota bacterium]